MTDKTENLSNILIVGQVIGKYQNQSITKEFKAKVLVSAKPDGTVIVHDLSNGIRPICYINEGAEISLTKTDEGGIEFFATTEDGQKLELNFTDVTTMQGIDILAMSVLQCVFDMGGTYGRITITRVLTGSVSKKILNINVSKLRTYSIAKDVSMKETLALIDWLIEENYLAYVEDSEFPVLVVTGKGLDILAGDVKEESKKLTGNPERFEVGENSNASVEEVERRKNNLKEWCDRK